MQILKLLNLAFEFGNSNPKHAGTGKGGASIFYTQGGKFADEIVESLKHHKRGVVSMANSGPNTNASQV